MKTITSQSGRQYIQTESGTCYHTETPEHIINTIEKAIKTRKRVHVTYKDGFEDFTGYTKDGLNVSMYIGRSTGTIKIPLHICSSRSIGGPALSTDLIKSIYIK